MQSVTQRPHTSGRATMVSHRDAVILRKRPDLLQISWASEREALPLKEKSFTSVRDQVSQGQAGSLTERTSSCREATAIIERLWLSQRGRDSLREAGPLTDLSQKGNSIIHRAEKVL